MNNKELAEEIKQQISKRPTLGEARWVMLNATEWRQIIAALRRGLEPVPEGFVRTVPDPQMRTICTAEAMGQLAERPPSGEMVMDALERSVRLQSHYAVLLNMHDGGKRILFDDAAAWLKRLAVLSAAEAEGRK
jgi:hypothetical protein